MLKIIFSYQNPWNFFDDAMFLKNSVKLENEGTDNRQFEYVLNKSINEC